MIRPSCSRALQNPVKRKREWRMTPSPTSFSISISTKTTDCQTSPPLKIPASNLDCALLSFSLHWLLEPPQPNRKENVGPIRHAAVAEL